MKTRKHGTVWTVATNDSNSLRDNQCTECSCIVRYFIIFQTTLSNLGATWKEDELCARMILEVFALHAKLSTTFWPLWTLLAEIVEKSLLPALLWALYFENNNGPHVGHLQYDLSSFPFGKVIPNCPAFDPFAGFVDAAMLVF